MRAGTRGRPRRAAHGRAAVPVAEPAVGASPRASVAVAVAVAVLVGVAATIATGPGGS